MVRELLTITGYGAKFTGHEMIRRPRSADDQFAVFELFRGCAVSILIFFDGFGIDQVGDIEEHAVSVDLLTADFLLERVEQLVYLNRKRSGLCLALALTRGLDPQLGEVVPPHGIGKDDISHCFS